MKRSFVGFVILYIVDGSLPTVVLADVPVSSDLVSQAQRGNAVAEYEIGQRYRGGRGVPQSYADAVDWYRKSADQGYAPAEARLGGMYLAGYGGLPKDENEGRRWLNKAAKQGDRSARRELAIYDGSFARWLRTLPSGLRSLIFLVQLIAILLVILGVIVIIFRLIFKISEIAIKRLSR